MPRWNSVRPGAFLMGEVHSALKVGTGCGSGKKLVKGLIEAVAGGVRSDPAEGWYVPAIPLDKPTLVAEIPRTPATRQIRRRELIELLS